ncbi:MAG TPA: phosphatidylglycerophosphatase A [Bacilli bacterium]|jgi:phosphatidylglycerophosphatase A|nr:MAG: Phosphatidylglycerophosphatase A [Tenericutes bacterium ADurb.Bin140]HOE77507.1 phosphatidylglycerophosphatase A [Bacilli bacterium]HON64464.1 phosphatidylglycerophosphatase A [Bacilli bacterium]HOR95575.1 phosphatidylglycerophosphatase A [Bacilli bacterium]HPD12807.1 phosphatidylglycerophosphatase A [Bacilli bacterium]
MKPKLYYSREEMLRINVQTLMERGVTLEEIAEVAFKQQSKYNNNVEFRICLESVEKILSLRDIFHLLQLGAEIDRLAEEGKLRGPIQDIIRYDLGVFGVDEIFGIDIARLYGAIGQTNFGDIDVNKHGVVEKLNLEGKSANGRCHTFLDDIVGGIAAAASTRVAQIITENEAQLDPNVEKIRFDI